MAAGQYAYPPPADFVRQPYPPQNNDKKIPITGDPIYGLSDVLIADAQTYASIYDVSLEEALRRLRLQDLVENINASLMINECNTFAGLWIQNEPDYRIIVLFTRHGKETIKPYIQNSPLNDLIEVRTANTTLEQLKLEQTYVTDIMNQSKISFTTGINVIDNRVELHVVETKEMVTRLPNMRFSFPDHFRIIKAIEVGIENAAIYGGLGLTNCTSGFSVVDGEGTKGITTAGHCNDVQFFHGVELIFKSGTLPGQAFDIQWHKADLAFNVVGNIEDGLGGRAILKEKLRINQVLGGFVCKYGKTTGRECGSIAEIYINGINVRVDIPVLDGDSGGPWFLSDIAYGTTIYRCVLIDGTICAIYGPIDQIHEALGLSLVYQIYLPFINKR